MSDISKPQIWALLDLEREAMKNGGEGFGSHLQGLIDFLKMEVSARNRLVDRQRAVHRLMEAIGHDRRSGMGLMYRTRFVTPALARLDGEDGIPVDALEDLDDLRSSLRIGLHNVVNRFLRSIAVDITDRPGYWITVLDKRHQPEVATDGFERATLREALMYFVQCPGRLEASMPLLVQEGKFSFFRDELGPQIIYHGEHPVDQPDNLFVKRYIY